MNQPSDRYYEEHAEEYVRSTVGLPMDFLYRPFLELVQAGGRILDAGCGSGRDTKAFLDLGYDVVAIDGSPKMVAATTRLTGRPARCMRFEALDFDGEFDGMWACASLLHVSPADMNDVLDRIQRALRPGGICYMSFKEGDGHRFDGDRQFTDFTAESLRTLLGGFEVIRIWTTGDLRPDRLLRWVNALVRKD